MSHWIYANEYKVFKKGEKVEKVFSRYMGYCTDPNCNCEGNMTYQDQSESDYEEEQALRQEGFVFDSYETDDLEDN